MIVVTVQLVSAVTGKTTDLGKMLIANDGTALDPRRGNYDVWLGRKGKLDLRQVHEAPLRRARVEKYPRAAFSIWVLVARALKNLGIERFADFYEDATDEVLRSEGL